MLNLHFIYFNYILFLLNFTLSERLKSFYELPIYRNHSAFCFPERIMTNCIQRRDAK